MLLNLTSTHSLTFSDQIQTVVSSIFRVYGSTLQVHISKLELVQRHVVLTFEVGCMHQQRDTSDEALLNPHRFVNLDTRSYYHSLLQLSKIVEGRRKITVTSDF